MKIGIYCYFTADILEKKKKKKETEMFMEGPLPNI